MTVKELIEYAKEFDKKAVALMEGKNHDYTKKETDALSNFEASVKNGTVDEVWQAVAVFVNTKMERIISLTKKGVDPKNEAVEDSFLDLHNYLVFLKVAVERSLEKSAGSEIVKPTGSEIVKTENYCIEEGCVSRRYIDSKYCVNHAPVRDL